MNKNVIRQASLLLEEHRANRIALECMRLRGSDGEGSELRALVGAVELALADLHPDDRYLLKEFYVNRYAGYMDRLQTYFNCSESSVYRRKRRAERMFAMRLFGSTGDGL